MNVVKVSLASRLLQLFKAPQKGNSRAVASSVAAHLASMSPSQINNTMTLLDSADFHQLEATFSTVVLDSIEEMADTLTTATGSVLLDPCAEAIWRSLGVEEDVPFPLFLTNVLQLEKSTGHVALRMKRHILPRFREEWLGTRETVSKSDIRKLVMSSQCTVFPECLFESANRFLEGAPSLCSKLAVVLDESDLQHRSTIVAIARDTELAFDEVVKLSSTRLIDLLEAEGVSTLDAQNVALKVYSSHRRLQPNTVIAQNRTERGIASLSRRDRSVDFSCCQINVTSLRAITENILANAVLQSIDLSRNNIHSAGADMVCSFIQKLATLHTLLLAGNNIQLSGAQKVLAASKGRPLRKLDLSCNHTGPSILSAFEGHGLEWVSLSGNDIGQVSDPDVLVPLLGKSLLHLNLSSNHFGNDGARSLLTSLVLRGGASSLNHLDLSNNDVSGEVVEELLLQCSTIQELDLSVNAVESRTQRECV